MQWGNGHSGTVDLMIQYTQPADTDAHTHARTEKQKHTKTDNALGKLYEERKQDSRTEMWLCHLFTEPS